MNTYRLKIDGMGCTHCVSKVTRILKESGFEVIAVDMGEAKIKSDMNPSVLLKSAGVVLEDEGYMLTTVLAD
ncbi:MAG TPA: ATPase P [Clostridiales bacterium]|nr:ATPase P [Clostridiales bacterium]